MTTQIARWGNSLGLRLPKSVAEAAQIGEGDSVEIVVEHGAILIRPARPTYALRDLVAKVTPENRHDSTDWGPAVGRESW
jgi:antitoxin MazE